MASIRKQARKLGLERALQILVEKSSIDQIQTALSDLLKAEEGPRFRRDSYVNFRDLFPVLPEYQFKSESGYLKYLLAIQQHFAEEIQDFLRIRDEILEHIFEGSLQLAEDKLEQLSTQCGHSYWAIEVRVLVRADFRSDDESAGDVLAAIPATPFSEQFKAFLWLKAQKGMSADLFLEIVESMLENARAGSPEGKQFSQYLAQLSALELMLLPSSNWRNRVSLIELLHVIQQFPLIDQFVLVRKISAKIACGDIRPSLLTTFARLKPIQNDRLSANLQLRLGHVKNQKTDAFPYEIHDLYTRGQYEEVINRLSYAKFNSNLLIDVAEICCNSIARVGLPKTTIFESRPFQILRDLSNVVSNGEHSEFCRLSIESHCFMFTPFDTSEVVSDIKSKYDTLLNPSKRLQPRYADYLKSPVNPRSVKLIPTQPLRLEFLRGIERASTCEFVTLYIGVETRDLKYITNSNFPSYRKLKYLSKIALHENNLQQLEANLLELATVQDRLASFHAQQFLVSLYLSWHWLDEAAVLCSSFIAKEESLFRLLPLNELCEGLASSDVSLFDHQMEICNVFCTHYRYYGHRWESLRRVSFGNYLDDVGCAKPSLRLSHAKELDFVERYFIGRNCGVDLLEELNVLKSDKEIDAERLEILQSLIALDTATAKLYQEEINEITKEMELRDLLAKLSSGKLNVDFDRIYESSTDKARIEFTKLKAYYFQGLQPDKIPTTQVSKDFGTEYPNHALQTFNKLFFLLLEQFIFSNDHGLDMYLSVRFRHGDLIRLLESIFDRSDLLLKIGKQGDYEESEKWCLSLGENYSNAHTVLKEIRTKLQEIIAWLHDQIFRARFKSETAIGMFDYRVTEQELIKLSRQLDESTAFRQVFDLCKNWFLSRTDSCLVKIRSVVDSSLRDALVSIIESALSDSRRFELDYHFTDELTRAKTSIRAGLLELQEWLAFRDKMQFRDYEIGLALQAAERTMRARHPNLRLTITSELLSNLWLVGSTFEAIFEIFVLALGNVVTHSRGASRGSVQCRIRGIKCQEGILLQISNELRESENLPKLRETISAKMRQLQRGPNDMVREDQNSGLAKIDKLTTVDLDSGNHLQVEVTSKRELLIEIPIPQRWLIWKESY